MNILVYLFVFIIAFAKSSALKDAIAFAQYKAEFNKTYSCPSKELSGFLNFKKSLQIIKNHNLKFDIGISTFELGLNKYSDMSSVEFKSKMNGFRPLLNNSSEEEFDKSTLLPRSLRIPESVDWREKGAVTEIRDQLTCGSCWTFASVAALESQLRIKGKSTNLFSEQELLDCVNEEKDGCTGGHMIPAFQYVKQNGLTPRNLYEYENEAAPCRRRQSRSFDMKLTGIGYVRMKSGDEGKLKEVIATIGVVSVAIDAELETFQHYKRGVYYDSDCSSVDLTHAVAVVGYGVEAGQDIWIIKNSWGASWGERGYLRLARNRHNHCGVATDPVYPTL